MRPLSTVEVLDAAWTLLRRQWALLYACSSAGTLPVALLSMGYFVWLGTLVQGTSQAAFYFGTSVWAAALAAAWALNSIARTAVTAAVLGDARGRPLSWGAAWHAAWERRGTSAFVGLAGFALTWLGGLAFVAPGLMLALGWWVSRPAGLDERRSYSAAMRRSRRLLDGHRSRAFQLWLSFLALWFVGALNLYLILQFILGTAAAMLGLDASALQPLVRPSNPAFSMLLFLTVFVLLDPLKTAADAVLYLDLKIRREGADLRERLRAARSSALRAAPILAALAYCVPAGAMPADEYLARVRALREQVHRAASPAEVDLRGLALGGEPVRMLGSRPVAVRSEWVDRSLAAWRSGGTKATLLRRLEALERSLGGVGAGARPPHTAEADPREAVQRILRQPEFQPLAQRDELRGLMGTVDLSKARPWWEGIVEWLRRALFRPRPAQPEAGAWRLPDLSIPVYALLGVTLLLLLALLARWIVDRPDAARRPGSGAAAPLESSATGNALDHSADEWERFAQEWLGQGDSRQAVRALYLATLVHLHRERRIDYNRALTNWVYVRHFRGDRAHQGTLRQLTRTFDEVWYGERGCSSSEYAAFEAGVRSLGAAPPVQAGR